MGWPLGVARRALDEFATLAVTKTRGPQRVRLADDPVLQLELARAEGAVQAARAFAVDVIGELWDTACAGDPLTLDQRARLSLAAQQAVRGCVQAVDGVFRLAGAGVATTDHPLTRCFRDLHTVDAHILVATDAATKYTKHLLGVPQPEYLL